MVGNQLSMDFDKEKEVVSQEFQLLNNIIYSFHLPFFRFVFGFFTLFIAFFFLFFSNLYVLTDSLKFEIEKEIRWGIVHTDIT